MTDARFDEAMGMIADGNKLGLKCIYEAYAKRIYQLIFGIVKNQQDAEDLTADLFMKLWETAQQYRSGSGHKRYITVMARNLAVDFLRKHNRSDFSTDVEDAASTLSDPQNVEKDVESSMSFAQALDTLNPKQRQIVDMHIGMQLTLSEISQSLNMPAGTVAWNYKAAIEKLKRLYKEGERYG